MLYNVLLVSVVQQSESVMHAKLLQLCPTLWDPMDVVHRGILQARIQEWVAMPSSRGSFLTQRLNLRLLLSWQILYH